MSDVEGLTLRMNHRSWVTDKVQYSNSRGAAVDVIYSRVSSNALDHDRPARITTRALVRSQQLDPSERNPALHVCLALIP